MGAFSDVVPVILLGGCSTVLRPLSPHSKLSPLLKVHHRKSLFQEAVLRGAAFSPPVIVCPASLAPLVRAQLTEIHAKVEKIIVEPFERGTAAASALAAFYLKDKGKLMLVMPSDHMIDDADLFMQGVESCMEGAQVSVVVMGVRAHRPDVSYGYIRQGAERSGGLSQITAFYEKPQQRMARSLYRDSHVLWNTGVFLTHPNSLLQELQIYAGDIYRGAQRSYFSSRHNSDTVTVQGIEFEKVPVSSLEHAIMEKSTSLFVHHADMRWSDVGTWKRFLRLKLVGT